VRLWDVATGQQVCQFKGNTGNVSNVRFSPDGQTLVSVSRRLYESSVSDNEIVLLWDVATGQELCRFSKSEYIKTHQISDNMSPDRKYRASKEDNTVGLWDVATGQQLRQFQGHTYRVSSVSFSPDGQTLASGSWDGVLRLWKVGF